MGRKWQRLGITHGHVRIAHGRVVGGMDKTRRVLAGNHFCFNLVVPHGRADFRHGRVSGDEFYDTVVSKDYTAVLSLEF